MKCHYEGTGYLKGRCVGTKGIDPCIGYERCAGFKLYIMTNAERIRAMSDEELAELLEEMTYDSMEHRAAYWLRWLRQPVKDGEGDVH